MTIIGKIAKDYCKEISSIDNIWETLYELLSNNLLCSNVLNALNNILIEYIYYIILYLLFNSESLVRAFLKTEGLSILSNLSVYIYYILNIIIILGSSIYTRSIHSYFTKNML